MIYPPAPKMGQGAFSDTRKFLTNTGNSYILTTKGAVKKRMI